MAEEPHLSALLEKIKPDMAYLRSGGEFGLKIYNKLAKQYPSLALDSEPMLNQRSKRKKQNKRNK